MATTVALGGGSLPNNASLSAAQTGNGASTNVVDRGNSTKAALITIVSTIGATPTVTVAVQGSNDATNWFSIPYADSATPTTVSVATFAITTATTNYKIVQPDVPVRYIRLNYSANTNVTLTASVDVF